MTITDAIRKLIDREDLTLDEARNAMEELMAGRATDAQIGSFLTALRMKGETSHELAGFAGVMRERAVPFWDGAALPVLDTCGTGGDRSGTFNISTAAAFVVAGAGLHAAKHGNRSASSKCGSADVMEALGVDIGMPVEKLRSVVSEIGVGFLFAQRFHSSMKHVMPARTQMQVRTVFNLIGPLSNPAHPRFQVIGVFSGDVLELVANALRELRTQRAFVVHGTDNVDEISISAPTRVVELNAGDVRSYAISPETFGVSAAPRDDLLGGDAPTNARIIEGILAGEKGARRNVVLMNAAAALLAAGAVDSLVEGFRMAADSIDTGRAAATLQQLKEASR
jgi:anthranilate phosphoribosyltransferase